MISQVLQVSVRLSEGGAAGVARTLADELESRGISSPFAYGYGQGGKASPLESEYSATRVTPRLLAGANKVAHTYMGRELGVVAPRNWDRLTQQIKASDVVHLHVLHSYFLPIPRLFSLLRSQKKPVVWTLHDQWAMTGRCAQPGACRLWESGCPKCPTLTAYPPSKTDFASLRWRQRADMIRALQTEVPTSIVACADWLGAEAKIAGLRSVSVVKNSVDSEFWNASGGNRNSVSHERRRVLFICRDLRDQAKVDWSLLSKVGSLRNTQLTIVGNAAPIQIPGAKYLPAVISRGELGALMRDYDVLLFSSKVDYYPLTVAEGLTAGLAVFAVDSRAAQEFASDAQLFIFDSAESLVTELENWRPEANSSSSAREFFQPSRMANEYIKIYESVAQ